MKDTFIRARLISPDTIRLMVFSSNQWEPFKPQLEINEKDRINLTLLKQTSVSNVLLCDYKLSEPLKLGNSYRLVCPIFNNVPVDVCEATTFPGFDEEFYYEGDDLGCTYCKEETKFALWAPLATQVLIKNMIKGVSEGYTKELEITGFNFNFLKFLLLCC